MLRAEDAALVMRARGGAELLVPDPTDDAEVARRVLILTALFLRLEREPGFAEEQIDWLEAARGQ